MLPMAEMTDVENREGVDGWSEMSEGYQLSRLSKSITVFL